MLREGWDVQNVTVIVGLRPYTAKANILPEQTIGRGLRLMFGDGSSSYVERVDVIGNPAFLKFVEQLEKDEDITLDTFDLKEPVVITTIEPDEAKLDHDITIPVLSPILARKKTLAEEIAGIDVSKLICPRFPKKEGDAAAQQFHYEGVDIITLQKLVERDYTIPEPQTAEEVISYYAKRIAQDVKLPSQFAALVPKVREFLRDRAFGETVDLTDKAIIRAIATSVAQYVTVKTFATVLRGLVVEELSPTLEHPGRPLSETEPFPFSRPTFEASKTVFNLVAADNEFERRVRPVPPGRDRCQVVRQAATAVRLRHRVHRQRHEPPLLRAGLRRRGSRWRALRHRDEGPGEHRRRAQGPGGDDLVRERDAPDRGDLALRQGAAGRVRQAAAPRAE